ncbi:MAG TPA: peptidoglycan-binding domain-containing protein [Pseudolabrys sp.]|nr:peptidoglycan-binding domain-containing protein [Pseudolabrys sp.]
MRKRIRNDNRMDNGGAGRLAAAIGRHPREFVGGLLATIAVMSISTNALFLQKGPHPAPIFATRPMQQQQVVVPQPRPAMAQPVPAQSTVAPESSALNREQLVTNIQRELGRRGFYDGAVDGIWGAKTDAATRDFIQAAGVRINPEPGDLLLRAILSSGAKVNRPAEPVRNDPIAELIAPSKRVLAIQRALSDFGYGQIRPTGQYDPDTRTAIEKFERDHRLPVTGQISDRVVRELASMTGRLLE